MEVKKPSQPSQPSPIPIRVIRFASSLDIPFRGMRDTLTTGTREGYTYTMAYEPWTRHHRITVTRDGKTESVFVHESQVRSWQPID